MKRLVDLSIIALIILLSAAAPLVAAEEKNAANEKKAPDKAEAKDPQAAEKTAIEEATKSYLKAFAEGDAEKVAKHWTENGEFFGASGRHVKGRANIEKEYADYFAMHPGQIIKPSRNEIRFIRPDVVLINGVSNVSPTPPGPPSKCTYSVTMVKQDGRWLMDNVRETMTFTPSNYAKLADLGWLVGKWTYNGDSEHIKSASVSCRWSRNKNYLLRKYVIRMAHEETHSGVQRIGWDPIAGSVCSWMFASDGSHTEGLWTKDDGRWVVQSNGVLRDGRKISSTNIITPIDADTFTFESINRTLDGRPEDKVGPIQIKRRSKRARK